MHENDIKFIFDRKQLINNYSEFKKFGNIFYPLKTNSNPYIVNCLNNIYQSNDGFLISNIEHYKLLINCGISPKKMCLINVLSSNDSIKYLYLKGVQFFVFDDFDSLLKFSKYADFIKCKISIRINIMEFFPNIFSHLGASMDECFRMLDFLNDRCSNIGISFYIPTCIKDKYKSLKKILFRISSIFKAYNIQFLSIGGLTSYLDFEQDDFDSIKIKLNLDEIILEPGKYLVDNTFHLKTKIVRSKLFHDKKIIIIKNGIYSGFLDILLYDKKFDFYLKIDSDKYVSFSNYVDDKHNYEIKVCGASSDSRDILGTLFLNEKYKNKLKGGNEIIIKNIGSYFEEFFMSYGGDINIKYEEV